MGALLLTGCRSGPTLEDARDLLEDGDPENALTAARGAADRALTKQDRISLRRVAFRASLNAGWSHEAASEYLKLRELTGKDEDVLLKDLGRTALRRAQTSQDRGRRLWLVRALDAVLGDYDAASLLRAAQTDEAGEVRAEAARVASHLSAFGEALAMLEQAFTDDDPAVRRAVVTSLRLGVLNRLGDEEASRAPGERISKIALAASRDPDEDVRLASLALLSELSPLRGGDAALDALATSVGNGSDAVARRAGRLLLLLSPERAWQAWRAARPAVDTLAPFGRALALHLGEVTPGTVEADLRSPDYGTRLASAQALAGPGAARLKRPLLELLEGDTVAVVRVAALEALLGVGGVTARRALRAAQESDLAVLRRRAFLAREAMHVHSVAELVGALEDPALAADVAPLLASRGGELGTQALVGALDSPEVRNTAAAALASRGDAGQREVYRRLLEDPDPRLRFHGGAGLAACGEAEDLARLVRSIRDPDGHADLPAAAALLAALERGIQSLPTTVTPVQ